MEKYNKYHESLDIDCGCGETPKPKKSSNCCGGINLPSHSNEIEILIRQLKREVDELMKTTEAKLLCQDKKIAETMVYIKNNLSNAIRNLLDSMLTSGEIEDIIETVALQNFDEIDSILNELQSEKTIFISDSYGEGISTRLINKMNLDNNNFISSSLSGSGFIGDNTTTFIELLQNISVTDVNLIKRIIVCGGYNDYFNYDSNYTELNTAIDVFYDYAHTRFPNAKIYLGFIGNNAIASESGALIRYKLADCLKRYKHNNKFIYINGIENIMHNYNYFDNDNVHPNSEGYLMLTNVIYNCINGSNYSDDLYSSKIITSNSSLITADNNKEIGDIFISNGVRKIRIDTELNFISSYNLESNTFNIGNIIANIRNTGLTSLKFPAFVSYKTSDNKRYGGITFISINNDNQIIIDNKFFKNDGNDIFPTNNVTGVIINAYGEIPILLS